MKNMCQSCGQPLKNGRGTEKNGSKSNAYCSLCFENGEFSQPDITLDEMKDIYVDAMAKMHFPKFIGRALANNQLPKLDRWKV